MIAAFVPWLIGYAVGAVMVRLFGWLLLSDEPAAQARIARGPIGAFIALLWPVAVPLLILNALFHAIADRAWRDGV